MAQQLLQIIGLRGVIGKSESSVAQRSVCTGRIRLAGSNGILADQRSHALRAFHDGSCCEFLKHSIGPSSVSLTRRPLDNTPEDISI